MIHLRELRKTGACADGFPFGLPAIRALDTLTFSAPVTFLVGANATGSPPCSKPSPSPATASWSAAPT